MPLLLVYSCLEEDNSSSIYISEEIPLIRTENSKQDILENTQVLIHRMEDIIRKHPEQWMWFHDRWNLYRDFKKDRKSTRLNSSHANISYAVFCLKKKILIDIH